MFNNIPCTNYLSRIQGTPVDRTHEKVNLSASKTLLLCTTTTTTVSCFSGFSVLATVRYLSSSKGHAFSIAIALPARGRSDQF
jgi:hypothetical protein